MKTCLITGGAGFLGAHLVAHLLAETDWNVVVWDALRYSAEGGRRLQHIQSSRYRFAKIDLATDIPVEFHPEYIVHLAGQTHVERSIENVGPFLLDNVMGTANLLQYARRETDVGHPIEKLLYFSTDEVFGPTWGEPCQEWSRYNSSNPYAATKAAGEELALAWANTFDLPVVVSHCCNIFGEQQNEEKFIPKVIKKIKDGDTIQIHCNTDGEPGSRMYVYAGDVARAIVRMLKRGDCRQKYNIAGEEVSNFEMVKKIAEIMRKSFNSEKVHPFADRPGWDFSYRIESTLLEERLGWHRSVNFHDQLRRTVESYL